MQPSYRLALKHDKQEPRVRVAFRRSELNTQQRVKLYLSYIHSLRPHVPEV